MLVPNGKYYTPEEMQKHFNSTENSTNDPHQHPCAGIICSKCKYRGADKVPKCRYRESKVLRRDDWIAHIKELVNRDRVSNKLELI
jgi:hypothetical protein